MWKCKECGSIVKVSLAYMVNKDFNIGEDGEPVGKCLRKYDEEYEGEFFYCPHCGKQSDFLKNIADWEEEK